MKIQLLLLLAILGIFSTGCASLGNQMVRTETSVMGGDYRVTMFSGGKPVRAWEIKNTIVHEEEGSDGWWFSCGGKLVRLSGDVVVEPLSERAVSDVSPTVCN